MTPLSDKKRRLLCRLLFFIGCVVPFAGTVYLLLHDPTVTDWEKLVKAETRLELRFERVETPTPNRTKFYGVKFANPALAELSRIPTVTVTRGETNFIEISGTMRLPTKGLAVLLETMQREVLSGGSLDELWEIRVDKIDLQDSSDSTRGELYGPLTVFLGRDSKGQHVLRAKVQKGGSEAPIELELSVDRDSGHEGLYLATGDTALPFWLIQEGWRQDGIRFSQGSFSGTAQLSWSPRGMDGAINGRFKNLDLTKLSAGYELEVKGSADIDLRQCHIENGRIRAAEGTLAALTNQFSVKGQKIMRALIDNPSNDSFVRQFKTKFLIANSQLHLDGMLAIDQNNQQLQGLPLSLPLQHAAHLLTSVDFIENPSDSRFDMANLNDRGISLLNAFQLDSRRETAEQPPRELRR
jgi:hypothetical protein